jgi:KaiC/GvpD/RAD55 family RecA-like ATPase
MTVTIFKNIIETKEPFYISIDKIVERIKNGNSRKLVNKIRGEYTKESRNNFKKQLPSICFSGKFQERANNKIMSHSGIVCLDFDHLENPLQFKKKLCEDKFVMCAFISPSGDGLKVLIKIPADIKTHSASCKALKDYFKNDKLDNFEDVARVCFESYDPDIYYNPGSEIFKDLIYEETHQIQNTVINTDTNQIFDNIKKWIENIETYQDGNKHKFLVKFAGALNRFGVPLYEASNLLINHYQNAASYVKTEHFEKIVNKVYSTYRNQFNISFFEKTGVPIERTTKKRLTAEIFTEYSNNEEKEFKLKKILEISLIDLDKEYKEPPIFLGIKDDFDPQIKRICTPGNISAIAGKYKSKKSFFVSMLAAASVQNYNLFNKIVPSFPDNKRQVLIFDTEQSTYDVYRVANRIKKLTNSNVQNLGVLGLRGLEAKLIIQLIEYSLTIWKYTGILFIDQVADLAKSINDESEAVEIVRNLERITKEKDIHICCVIHQNKADNYASGWLGSQIMKKAETVIDVEKEEKNKDVSYVKPSLTRSQDFESFGIIINKHGLPELVNQNTLKDYNTEMEL